MSIINANSGTAGVEFDREAFSARLVRLIGRESYRSFAKRCDMSDTGLKKYVLEGTIPPVDRAMKIAAAAGVDFGWLCTGVGNEPAIAADGFYVREEMPSNYLMKRPLQAPEVSKDTEFTLIDSFAVFASAGHGSEIGHELQTEPMSFRTDWLRKEGLPKERLAVIRAKGDSMEPTISDNDVILVLLSNGDAPRDGLHVIRLDGGLFVKRLQFDPLGSVHVKSDNPVYTSVIITKEQRDQVHIIGRVVWAGKKF